MRGSISIVGDGVAALICFGILRQHGVPTNMLTVYGDSPYPLAALEHHARAIGQQRMRSESTGHTAPAEFPGLATIATWRHRSPWPLLASLFDAYHPPLDLVLAHSRDLAERSGFMQRKVPVRVGAILRHDLDRFELFDAAGNKIGSARHVIFALGWPGLAWPDTVQGWQSHPAVAHVYAGCAASAGERVVIVGSGMAAVYAWIAALQRGATVTALHRRPLRRQALNAARCQFQTAGIRGFQSLSWEQRRAAIRSRSSTFPRRWQWEWLLWQARRQGWFTNIQGEISKIEAHDSTLHGLMLQFTGDRWLTADRLICATGFRRDADAHPVIAQLVQRYQLPLVDHMLCVANDFSLPELSWPGSICGVIGGLAGWALPVADTFVGMKYIARRLAPLVWPQSSAYPLRDGRQPEPSMSGHRPARSCASH